MKTTESLKSELFQKFEDSKLSNLAKCLGGAQETTYDKVSLKPVDCANYGTSDGHKLDGLSCDWSYSAC
jgi:hypothetical protein